VKLRAHFGDVDRVLDDDDRDMPAAVVGAKGLDQSQVAGGREVDEDDLGQRLLGTTDGVGMILGDEYGVALALEARLMGYARRRVIVDQQSGTGGVQGEPHYLLLG